MNKLRNKEPQKEPSPAVSPMLIVRRKVKLRICLNPSENILRRPFPLTTIEEISADVLKVLSSLNNEIAQKDSGQSSFHEEHKKY